MVSLVNPYFPKDVATERDLFSKLKSESIKIMGRTYYYIPRNMVLEDIIMNEDVISKFPLAIPIEMYLEDVQGFQGDKEMFSKFGLQIQNSYRLTVAQFRWEEEVKSQFDNSSVNGEADFDITSYMRPHEGDLIYDPMTKFLMEIRFVDHDQEFYQLGKNYLYSLSCEAFRYASEDFSTGISEIDNVNSLSNNLLDFQITMEDGGLLLQEDCDFSLLQESRSVEPKLSFEDGMLLTERGEVILLESFVGIIQMPYGDKFDGLVNVITENPFGEFV